MDGFIKAITSPRFWFVFMLILLIFGTLSTYQLIKTRQEWRNECFARGLPDKCTSIDECKKNCVDLGKGYYKTELGGLFGETNCWCKEDNETVMIW